MSNQNDIVIGLLFGDETKGATVDWLAAQQETNAVFRFSGGQQTLHHVFSPSGEVHGFRQFGSGSFSKVRTILTRHALVSPFDLPVESEKLKGLIDNWDPIQHMLISENALVTTPLHRGINRRREQLRGVSAHGSCGLGIGETTFYSIQHPDNAIRVKDLSDMVLLRSKLEALNAYALQQVDFLEDIIPDVDSLMNSYRNLYEDKLLNVVPDSYISEQARLGYNVWEGTQGVLLDEDLGFHPHNTWTSTTQMRAQELIAEANMTKGQSFGVVRNFLTRHGHGPFPSEIANHDYFEAHNKRGVFQGGWRAGLFDIPLFNYAIQANGGVDQLVVSHMDIPLKGVVTSYPEFPYIPLDVYADVREDQFGIVDKLNAITGTGTVEKVGAEKFFSMLEATASAQVFMTASGPSRSDRSRR